MTLPDPDTTAIRAKLGRISQAYLRQARALSYRDLCKVQDPPWACIRAGAAGIATALSRSSRRRHGSHNLESARRWTEAAMCASRARGAFRNPELDSSASGRSAGGPSSFYGGVDGIHFLHLLSTRGPGPEAPSALRSFLGRCRRWRAGPSELYDGIAGHLTALVILYRTLGEPSILRVADVLANDLLDRAGGRRGWASASDLGFAHGRAGTFHALLGWSLAGRRALPAEFYRHLDRLAVDVEHSGTMGVPSLSDAAKERLMQRSFCNGAAGLTLLWARAHEHTPDQSYLRNAREAARFVLTRADRTPGDLCCGLGGRAYALLAMDRLEPGQGWFEQAIAMASRAADALLEGSGPWPNGLFTGYPGLVCLERDVSGDASGRVGFPLVEGL